MEYILSEISDVIRSKNSGPYELTFDIIFKDSEMLEKVTKSGVINKEMFAELYKIDKKDVLDIISFPPAKAIKITIVRPMCSGSLGETDVYGAQQHVPLSCYKFTM